MIDKLEDDGGVDVQDIAKSINQMPCHLGSYLSGHSEQLMNNVIREIDGFCKKNIYYGVTDSAYIQYIRKKIGPPWLITVLLVNPSNLAKTTLV